MLGGADVPVLFARIVPAVGGKSPMTRPSNASGSTNNASFTAMPCRSRSRAQGGWPSSSRWLRARRCCPCSKPPPTPRHRRPQSAAGYRYDPLVSRGCRLTSQVRTRAVRSALCQPVADRTRKVRDVVGVAGRDQIAIDHDGHVVAPDASVLLHDRPDDKVGVLAGEMKPREMTAFRDS